MRALLALLLLAPLAACSSGNAPERRTVAVGAYPFAWLVQQVVGDQLPVVTLVKPGVEPHDVELTPKQVAESQSAVVLALKGFQPAVDELPGVIDLAQADGVDILTTDRVRDPHVWLDPIRMKALGRYVHHVLNNELSLIASGDGYGADDRVAALEASLDQLDKDIRGQLQDCRTREIVTSHASFAYFAQRYGLTQRGISGLDPEAEPSPKRLKEVASFAKQHGVKTIFFESLVSPKVAETVAAEVGARTAVLDPLESVSGSDDYLTVMRRNAKTLHDALGCR